MKRLFSLTGLGLLVATGLYEVTITNLTRGQEFTPIFVASHRNGIQVFTLGHAASPKLATLPEKGNAGPITGLLLSLPVVRDVQSSSGLLNPGHSVTVTVEGDAGFDHLSAPGDHTLRLFSPAYDAGRECNE
jgi:hypothetical protein